MTRRHFLFLLDGFLFNWDSAWLCVLQNIYFCIERVIFHYLFRQKLALIQCDLFFIYLCRLWSSCDVCLVLPSSCWSKFSLWLVTVLRFFYKFLVVDMIRYDYAVLWMLLCYVLKHFFHDPTWFLTKYYYVSPYALLESWNLLNFF